MMKKKGTVKDKHPNVPVDQPATNYLLSAILNNTHALIACLDTGFNFIIVNEAYARADGREPDFFPGKNHFALYPDKENELIFRRVVETGEPYFASVKPFRYSEHPERGVSHWDWSLKPVKDDNSKISLLIFTLFDSTPRVKAEESLRSTNERLRKILDVDAVGVMFWDLTSGHLVDANDAFLNMVGYNRDDIIASKLTWQKFTPPEYHKVSLDEVKKFRKTGNVGPYEKEYFCKDGTRKWFLFSGSSLGGDQCIEFCIDISDRKKFEDELDAANRLVQSIINNTPAIVYALDLDEHFILANKALAKILNTKPELMIGKKRRDFMPEEDACWHESNDLKVIVEGKMLEFEEYSNLKGRTITWFTTKFPLFDGQGRIYAVAGISADISERKRLEAELKKHNVLLEDNVQQRTVELKKQQAHLEDLNKRLIQSNKELENFAYIASHDLQEPLRMVTSFTQLLALRYKDKLDDNANEYIKFAVDGAKRMYELINGLLAYSRISRREITFTEVDLNNVFSEVKANLNLIIKEKNCVIESENLPVVFADKNQMVRIFQNLISNAIKFCNDQPHIQIKSKTGETHFQLSVKDNGIGIDPVYFEKIFEIFKRLMPKDQYDGTGLGLAICKRIVENHNGAIWVESEPGKGAIFHFTIAKIEPMVPGS